jgi:RNA-directed DNA polymerase
MNDVEIDFSDDVAEGDRARIMSYVERLLDAGLPPILSGKHLAQVLGLAPRHLYSITNAPEHHYRTFYLPKASGGTRRIDAPLPMLLDIQRWILDEILYRGIPSSSCKSYQLGLSIVDHAKTHLAQNEILKADLQDFFGSVRAGMVYSLFLSLGYLHSAATILTRLTTFDGCLPQGAPTSGQLSNLALRSFDERIISFCEKSGLRYTRYADDIAISGENVSSSAAKETLREEAQKIGLKIHPGKTKYLRNGNCKRLTGIVVNERLSPGRSFLRQIRQEVYYIERFGIYGHARYLGSLDPLFVIERLIGKVAFACYVMPESSELIRCKSSLLATRKSNFGF